MQLLYFGTVCDIREYEKFIAKSKQKPSVAPIIFESALLSGFHSLGVDAQVHSFPMVPDFMRSKVLAWSGKQDKLSSGYTANWIPTVNLPFLKQLSRKINAKKIIKKWLRTTAGEDRAVLIYSVCPYIAPSIVKYCKRMNVPCFVIVPDLPQNMFLNRRLGGIKAMLSNMYLRPAIECQSKFDGYVYLTKYMKEAIGSDAPYTVVEGIVNADSVADIPIDVKPQKRSVMYAGGLNEKYGIKNLIEAFMRLSDSDIELWLFGSGNFESSIKEYAAVDSRIRFFGRVSHDEIIEYERKATLLVNVRGIEDEYTKYSFPSKTIEYMLSGTPLMSTRLPGIPSDYEDYIYLIEDNSVELISEKLSSLLSLSDSELTSFGQSAREFILDKKNPQTQAKKIVDLINKVKVSM